MQGYHTLLALFTKVPIFIISDDEAEAMANSVVRVSEFYDLNVLSGPKAALFGMASTFGMVYFNKILLLKAMNAAARARPATEPATPSEAAVNAGIQPNVVNLTGDHLSNVRMP